MDILKNILKGFRQLSFCTSCSVDRRLKMRETLEQIPKIVRVSLVSALILCLVSVMIAYPYSIILFVLCAVVASADILDGILFNRGDE